MEFFGTFDRVPEPAIWLEFFAALVVRLERWGVEFGIDGSVLFKPEEGA